MGTVRVRACLAAARPAYPVAARLVAARPLLAPQVLQEPLVDVIVASTRSEPRPVLSPPGNAERGHPVIGRDASTGACPVEDEAVTEDEKVS
jgi:hypothetical protein